MKLHFLGTRSAFPTTRKAASSLALQHDDGQVWLFDCGEGTQIQLQKVSVTRQNITKIFITHLHGDHLFGLPGLLCSISMGKTVDENAESSSKKSTIEIYGPKGLSRFIYTVLSLSHAQVLNFNYKVFELEPIEEQFNEDYDKNVDHSALEVKHSSELPLLSISPSKDHLNHTYWPILKDSYFEVKAGWIAHGVPSYGYMVREQDKKGTLNKDALLSFGVKPGPMYGKLKKGESIISPTGETITPNMVIGPSIKGRTVLILGDTSDASTFLPCIKSCDVLVHESTHDDTLKEKAIQFGHSTPSMAANIAKSTGAKFLLLNHFSQRYASPTEGIDPKETTQIHEDQAKMALEGTGITVICTDDLFCFEVSHPQRIIPTKIL